MILLFFSLVLHLSSADYLSTHLTHNVNVTIDPCDNFYLHVCSQSIDERKFPYERINRFYEKIREKYEHISQSYNLAILNDIALVQETTQESKPTFDHSTYRELVEKRCGDYDACYWNEFKFVSNLYNKTFEESDRLNYFANNLERENREKILNVLTSMIDSIYDNTQFNETHIAEEMESFYEALTNRLFVMEEIKARGIFKKVPNLEEDIKYFKEIIIEKFKNTPWMNEEDDLGLSLLPEFENKINDLGVYYDLDENDRDLELLRKINGNFLQNYYAAKQMHILFRSTGVEILDILFALFEASDSLDRVTDPEESILVTRVKYRLMVNALNTDNMVAILAPLIYPKLTSDKTFNKIYDIFQIIGHEIFHSVINKTWAHRSEAFKNGMECYNGHFNRTCQLFGEESCNSGPQTFEEDGPDVEGLRIAYEFFWQYHTDEDLKEVIFKSDSLTVDREQAFFYMYGIYRCQTIRPGNYHADEHSYHQVRVNGDMTQLPEFTQAFSCNSDQTMYSTEEDTCHLFGPNSK